MQPKVIIISLIAGIIFIGAVGIAVLLYITPKATPTQTEPTDQNPSQNTNTNTGGTVTVPQPTATDIDFDVEYKRTLGQLSATQLQMNVVTETSSTMKDIYALAADDIAQYKQLFPAATTFPIHVAAIDLSGDGVAEAVVYEDLPGYCGSGGCPISIYKKEGKNWTLIFSDTAYPTIGVRNTKTNGYSDLLLSVQGSDDFTHTRIATYRWGGETYEQTTDAAVWNGTTFTVMQ